MSLEQIAQRCKAGDSVAQREIYEVLSGRMLAVLMRFVRDRARAEDLLHDGFIRLFDKIGLYRGDGSFEGWARRVFVSVALTDLRSEKRRGYNERDEELARTPCDDPSVLDKMGYDYLMQVIEGLAEKERTVLLLYSVEGYSHEEIAEQLGISEANSRIILHRAKGHLMTKIER